MNSKGFTLIELIIVLSILGILSLVSIPRYLKVSENAKRDVCEANRSALEYAYEIYLVQNDKDDTDVNFNIFLNEYDQEICPEGGSISRSQGKVNCSIHKETAEEDDSEEGPVPFL